MIAVGALIQDPKDEIDFGRGRNRDGRVGREDS
jgi:hypothetical protein